MRQDWRIICLFVGGVLIVGAIVGGPLLYSIKLSFYAAESFIDSAAMGRTWKLSHRPEDRNFWDSLLNGITISISAIVLQVTLGVGIALVLNRQFVGQAVVRALSIVPYFLPTVVACLIAQWMLDPNYGLIKSILASFGSSMFDWGANSATAKGTIVLVSVWIWTPFVVTCVLAGLQTIPVQLYEAARVDGASAWKQFWHITLPGLRSVLIVVILLRGIWMFNKFDVIWLLTKGGPLNRDRDASHCWPIEKRFWSSTRRRGGGRRQSRLCFWRPLS